MDEQIKKMMKILGCSEEEAKQIVKDDAAIDKGEKLFEMTAEQKAASKKARATGTKKRAAYKFDKRERKPNEVKRLIIDRLARDLAEWDMFEETFAQTINTTNIERSIDFNVEGRNFTLTLTEHRKPKEGA